MMTRHDFCYNDIECHIITPSSPLLFMICLQSDAGRAGLYKRQVGLSLYQIVLTLVNEVFKFFVALFPPRSRPLLREQGPVGQGRGKFFPNQSQWHKILSSRRPMSLRLQHWYRPRSTLFRIRTAIDFIPSHSRVPYGTYVSLAAHKPIGRRVVDQRRIKVMLNNENWTNPCTRCSAEPFRW
jgi:hypothetical protein